MKNKKIGFLVAGGLVFLSLGIANIGAGLPVGKSFSLNDISLPFEQKPPPEAKIEEWKDKGTNQYQLNHQQEIWLAALEWHESQGIETALNPSDRNGKRSVGCYQFQDETFRHYVEKYQLLDIKNLDESDWLNWIWDCDLKTEIVRRMLGDSDVAWKQEFPDVVKTKIGLPPKAN